MATIAYMPLRYVGGNIARMLISLVMSLRDVDGNVACYVLEIRGWRRSVFCVLESCGRWYGMWFVLQSRGRVFLENCLV